MTGLIFNIQRFSIHDGPGIRTTVFLKGCPADCLWCHNPEARSTVPELSIRADRCIDCGACVEACPEGAARRGSEPPGRDPLRCIACGSCVEACPTGARLLLGRETTVPELMRQIDKDTVFYEHSGGGVTFSGGEPLAQPGFLLEALRACRERGHSTVVDTCGAAREETLLQAAGLADLVLYDLKLMDDVRHRRYVGISNRRILANLEALAASGADVWIRVPVIPGVNDDADNLRALGAFVAALPRAFPLYLLPYHAIGADKYRRRDESYRLEGLEPPSDERMAGIAADLRRRHPEVRVGA